MLPQPLPSAVLRQRVSIDAMMLPAKEVGGDFYDFFMLGRDQVCVLVGDASGKGVPAAMFVAVGKSLLKAEAHRGGRPHEIVARVNRSMCQDNSLCMFITLLCLTINTRTGEAECCCAGHEYPLICRANGAVDMVKLPAGKAIGVLPSARYRSCKFRLNAGETLFTYTDGVTEAINSQQQCFSRERLLQCLASHGRSALPQLLAGVNTEVETYRGSEPQFDDITLAAVRFLGAPRKPRSICS
jgi:sigma-B regulation protein RsbU (phosphoserine phosphatase)